MVVWKFFCVCCDGLFGDQIRPCHFMPEMVIIAVAATTTVDTLLMYSATGINHHMLNGRSGVNNFFSIWSSKLGQKQSEAQQVGKVFHNSPPFFFPSLQYYFAFLNLPIRTVCSRLTKVHVLYLYSSGSKGNTSSDSVALV